MQGEVKGKHSGDRISIRIHVPEDGTSITLRGEIDRTKIIILEIWSIARVLVWLLRFLIQKLVSDYVYFQHKDISCLVNVLN